MCNSVFILKLDVNYLATIWHWDQECEAFSFELEKKALVTVEANCWKKALVTVWFPTFYVFGF